MNPEYLIRDALKPDALGLAQAEFDSLVSRVMDAAEQAAPGNLPAQGQHALAYLHNLEAQHWRRQLSSGSGAEGSFSTTEIGARMAAATADRDAAQAAYARLMPAPVTETVRGRGSGSVPISFEP